MSVCESNSHAIKNGKRAGTTELTHKLRPFFAAVRLSFENTIKPIVNKTKIAGKSCFFNCIKMKLILKFLLIILILYENVLKIEVKL